MRLYLIWTDLHVDANISTQYTPMQHRTPQWATISLFLSFCLSLIVFLMSSDLWSLGIDRFIPYHDRSLFSLRDIEDCEWLTGLCPCSSSESRCHPVLGYCDWNRNVRIDGAFQCMSGRLTIERSSGKLMMMMMIERVFSFSSPCGSVAQMERCGCIRGGKPTYWGGK